MYMYTSGKETRQFKAKQLHLKSATCKCKLIQRDKVSKATMPKYNSLKWAASSGIQARDVLRARQTLYQLSHRGSSAGQAESLIQAKGVFSPDGQGDQSQY